MLGELGFEPGGDHAPVVGPAPYRSFRFPGDRAPIAAPRQTSDRRSRADARSSARRDTARLASVIVAPNLTSPRNLRSRRPRSLPAIAEVLRDATDFRGFSRGFVVLGGRLAAGRDAPPPSRGARGRLLPTASSARDMPGVSLAQRSQSTQSAERETCGARRADRARRGACMPRARHPRACRARTAGSGDAPAPAPAVARAARDAVIAEGHQPGGGCRGGSGRSGWGAFSGAGTPGGRTVTQPVGRQLSTAPANARRPASTVGAHLARQRAGAGSRALRSRCVAQTHTGQHARGAHSAPGLSAGVIGTGERTWTIRTRASSHVGGLVRGNAIFLITGLSKGTPPPPPYLALIGVISVRSSNALLLDLRSPPCSGSP